MNQLEICNKCVYEGFLEHCKEQKIKGKVKKDTFRKSEKEKIDPKSERGCEYWCMFTNGENVRFTIVPKIYCKNCKYKLELTIAEDKYQNCRCCDEYTEVRFNIKFKQAPICESCANTIMMQQIHWLVENNNAK